jgi:hypothetical protein
LEPESYKFKKDLIMKNLVAITLLLCAVQFANAQEPNRTDTTKKKTWKYMPEISGVIAMHYLNEFNTNGDTVRDPDGFRLFKARIEVKGMIRKKIGYDIMIDPRTPEAGGLLRDCYIELHHLKNHIIKIGRQKTQFGWENRQSTTESYMVNHAEMSDAVSRGETLRDNGIGLIGNIPITKKIRFEDAITFTNGTRMDVTGPYDFNTRKALWGRLGFRYKKKDFIVHAGGSFGIGGLRRLGDDIVDPADDVYVKFKRMGADLELDHKYFFLAGEYGMGTETAGDTLYAEPFGYQALLALKTKWKIGPSVRYDVEEDEWKVLTLGAYYGNPKDKYRILLNYMLRGNITDVPNGHDDRLYIQMQLRF